ncbi:serine protease DegQ [Azospirillum lipoferum]|uniref:Do family serine endopeptidase n=1 Tax=Azospirillum lipoferum TaxID=193 RepID=A0A5A9GVQ6_AZOLI|nr:MULTISPECIES: Do family serine endopeptidase [Azospirillum]KAA0597755.1 Do family serine endopeptidase [Azospirillum lipoferum]MCP1610108.1 serine protease DegQ [Azospirillum lipoferum]MDW5534399.1 Do family serine endopeptidase [Azospirillum sp. NL1]
MKMAVRPVVFAAAVGMAALAGGALVAPADSALGRAGSAIGLGASPAEAALPLGAVGGGTIAPMLEQVTPAVVNISVLSQAPQAENPLLRDPFFRRFFNLPDQMPQSKPQVSAGSGVIVDARNGYVVTNNHVVENAQEIAVTLKDRRRLRAKLIGRDAATDIALLQIKADGLTALPIGDSDRTKVGDFVVAIGNPFGLGQTVTSGIVSAMGRSGLKIEGYEDFIQTDASINPGNSGGALVNFQGELIGINTAIIGPAGGSVGIGFAVPVSIVRSVTEQLREYGEVRRGRLGVAIQDLTPDLAESMSLKGDEGALIAKIERGSPADSGGLRSGDVVIAVDGRPIRSATDFRNRIGLLRVGTPVQLTVMREGGQKSVTVRTQR